MVAGALLLSLVSQLILTKLPEAAANSVAGARRLKM